MHPTLRIRINLQKLRAKLSQEENRAMTEVEILQWLADAGFKKEADGSWLVLEPDLGQLDPSEVDSVEDA